MSDSTFSHSDFQKLNKVEEDFQKLLQNDSEQSVKKDSLKDQTIKNVLAYSKALSIRKGKDVDFIENILN